MANLAIIQNISEGKFFTKDSLGNLVELKVGDKVSLNDTIVAANSNTDLSKLELLFDTNELITLSQGETLLDETLLASTFGNEELAFDKKELDETLSAWNTASEDVDDMETAAGEETNAGDENNADGGALRSRFNSRDGDSTDVNSDLREASFGNTANSNINDNQIPTELLNPTTAPTIPVDTRVPASEITLSNPTVDEGNQITIVATVTNAPQTDLIITLNNGEKITIPAGETTGSVTFDNPNSEDAYIDNETIVYTITETEGGNYVDLDTSDTSTVTINDTIQDTTVTLNDVKVDEGTGTAKITATIDNAPTKEPLVLTLSNGATVTFAIGATTATSTEFAIQSDDVYVDKETYDVTIKEVVSGGSEFENLVTNTAKGTVTVDDTTDTTIVTIATENIDGGKNIKITLSLSNKDGLDVKVTETPLVVTLSDGTKITIPVEETTGDITVPNPKPEGGEVTYTIDKDNTTGGNYEALDTTSTSTIVTKDIIPPVISIKGSEPEEVKAGTSTGTQVKGTVTISITKALDEDLDVTFTHNDIEYTVTIEKGETSVEKIVDTNRKDDYYKQDTTTEDIVITKTSNSDIVIKDENGELNVKDKITINDDIDPVTVKITAVETTDKVINTSNLQNNAGFTVTAKDPYGGNDAKISIHGSPSGFGVESTVETNSGKLGQTDQVYSGHTSEIGVVKDGNSYKSESIEVEFKNPIQTLDVAFAWRHNGERAKVDFYNGDENVGYAIVKGGGTNTDAVIEYYDASGVLKHSVNAQGGTDQVDLVYTFKPADDVSFTKAVFSADGAGSDYLIHSINYKEVTDGDSTTIVGSNEVAFKIETSIKPDPKWLEAGNKATADVKIVDNYGNIVFEGNVDLDANGKAIVTVRTDGTTDLTATVTNVQGNYEEVNYDKATTTIEGTLVPKASDDSISTNEDTQYTLTKYDFGDNNDNVAQIKFNTVPENGKIYVLKTEVSGSMNDKAEYSESTKDLFVEIKAGDIVDISKINSGSVIFVPNENTDNDSSFNFSISNGTSAFNGNYTTTIDVFAVVDVPTASIDVENTETAGEYTVKIEAALTDKDGSETLKVTITGVPASAELLSDKYKVTKNEDGSYFVKVPAGATSIADTLTMKVPVEDAKNIKLDIEAKATEARDDTGFKIATDSDALIDVTDETSNITVDKGDTNLVLVLDVSGSMVRIDGNANRPVDLDGNGTTRFDVLKQSMISTIEAYKAGGNTMVNLTLFGANAKNLVWMSADNALDYLKNLEMGSDAKVTHLGQDVGVTTSHTNYYEAMKASRTAFDAGKQFIEGAENKVYFITDGAPNQKLENLDFDRVPSGGGDNTMQIWEKFIDNNNADLKVIGVGIPDTEKVKAEDYLKIMNLNNSDIIIIDEPSSIETVILGTVEGTVFGDVSDNFTGGDGKITINSIEVDGITYTKADMPKDGLQIGEEGKLLFDFETGKYAYNGNGADITKDEVKSFKVNVSDESENESSVNINFELNKDQNDGKISFEKGGDINFSNLENITELNLDNGQENKLSLTLDDVLKLSGDNNLIKISGDEFDSVSFKNTTGDNNQEQTWSKTVGTGEDTGFDIYVNSGDDSLKVKVEQPISDGITS